jgi:hypothetical protein
MPGWLTDAVHPPPLVFLLRGHDQSELLAQRPGHGTTGRMSLPPRCHDNFFHRRAGGGTQHLYQHGLLRSLPLDQKIVLPELKLEPEDAERAAILSLWIEEHG